MSETTQTELDFGKYPYFGKPLQINNFDIKAVKEYKLLLHRMYADPEDQAFNLEFVRTTMPRLSIQITNVNPEVSIMKENEILIVIEIDKDDSLERKYYKTHVPDVEKEIYNLPLTNTEKEEVYQVLHKIYDSYKKADFITPFIEFFLLLQRLQEKQKRLKEEIEKVIKEVAQNIIS